MITLLSDFGLQDPSVAITKGILLQHIPGLPIVDITHEVTPYSLGQAAYLLASAYKNFPAGTCHVLLFDIFSEPVTRLILSAYNGHYFLSSDCGLVPLALGVTPADSWLCTELNPSDTFNDWLRRAGEIAVSLQARQPDELGLTPYQLKTAVVAVGPVATPEAIQCEAIHIDHYENVIINITRPQLTAFSNGKPFRLQFMEIEEINEISGDYSDVRGGFKLCRFNNNDHLEIAINHGKAASLFGLRLGGKLNNIKILLK
jgi:S-adenosylmethionine hydrolase